MKKVKLFDFDAKSIGDVQINDQLLVEVPHKQAMFDQVIAEDSGKRQGTHSTLTKAEVRGGGRKPVPQKHTGNARQGSTRNPHWVGGGVCFGPKPENNYKKKVNAKVSKLAFKSALSSKISQDGLIILVDEIKIKKPSTKVIIKLLNDLHLTNKKVLFAVNKGNDDLIVSISNIEKVVAKNWDQVSTKDLMNAKVVIYQKEGINKLMEAFE